MAQIGSIDIMSTFRYKLSFSRIQSNGYIRMTFNLVTQLIRFWRLAISFTIGEGAEYPERKCESFHIQS
jgi:hypothetical protein